MKLLIVAGPYEADRIRRAAVIAGIEAVAVEPGESLSGWINASRPDAIVLAPRVINPDPAVALAKVRSVPAGRVTTFLVGDAAEAGRMAHLGDGFFVRPLSPADLVSRLVAIHGSAADPGDVEPAQEFGAQETKGSRPPSLRPLVPETASRSPPSDGGAGTVALNRALSAHIEAAFDAEIEDAVRAVRPARDEEGAVAEFAEASSPKTVKAPQDLVASILAHGFQAEAPRAETLARGTLGEGDLPGLLARIYARGLTGRLVVRRGEEQKTVSFEGGHPVMATSSLPYDRMADMLYREGKITGEQYARGAEVVVETGRRMGAVLVDHGFIKVSELFPVVRRHFEEILFSLFAWHDADWILEPGPPPESEKIRLSRHPAALILEGIRRKASLARLLDWVGGPDTIVQLGDGPALGLLVEAGLTAEERQVVPLLDGARTLEDARAAAGVSAEQVYRLVWGLLVLGAVVRVPMGLGRSVEVPTPAPGRAGTTAAAAATAARDLAIDRERLLARYAVVRDGDYFQLLGVKPDATGHEIRVAYEALRRDLSPDSLDGKLAAELSAELAAIREVAEEGLRVLGDEETRRRYRFHLAASRDA